jgi:hypothetical protein
VKAGGRTPEELDTLLEDALVVRDRARLRSLFCEGAVFASGPQETRGGEAIGRAAEEFCQKGRSYLAGDGRLLRARGLALVSSKRAAHVACRGPDGSWRIAICLLDPDRQEDT